MNKLILVSMFLSTALSGVSAELWPYAHSACLNNLSSFCHDGSELLFADMGCGCLKESDYFDQERCRGIEIRCPEGTTFQTLSRRDRESPNMIAKGCGCFSLFDGAIPN